MTSVIYCITNIVNDKQYVGQAVNKDKRLRDHMIMLNAGKHQNRHLQSAYNKYGKENFIYTILEIVPNGPDLKDRLTTCEQYWMDKLNTVTPNGYNLNPTAATAIGFKHSEETKLKWSEQRKGQKRSDEFKKAQSERMKGRVFSEEAKANMSNAHKGYKASEETKALMSEQRKGNKFAAGRKHSKEQIEARMVSIRGIPKSEAIKARMSEAQKGRVLTPEHKLKLSIAARNRVKRQNCP